jgi:Ca-activated chloride channel family protein
LESKKSNAIWGFRIDKKLSPDRSVFKPIFKLVVILLALAGLILDWSIKNGTKMER